MILPNMLAALLLLLIECALVACQSTLSEVNTCSESDIAANCKPSEGVLNIEANASTAIDQVVADDTPPNQCGLYLAPSSIPGAGLGLFTGVPREKGESVGPQEIAHQIIEEFHDEQQLIAGGEWSRNVGSNYVAASHASGGRFEAKQVTSVIPGVGCIPNCIMPLVNIRKYMVKIDSAGINAPSVGTFEFQKGPGSGAFSAYHDLSFLAMEYLEPGTELFLTYGRNWFYSRGGIFEKLPVDQEYEEADEILQEYWENLPVSEREAAEEEGSFSDEWQDEWDLIRPTLVKDERTRNALPASVKDIPRAVNEGTALNVLKGEYPRSTEWLQTNGYCMDTLETRQSLIPQAGRGAFTKAAFNTGETILPFPLMQIDRETLNIYKTKDVVDDEEESDHLELHSRQLFLNYCLGDKDSSLLLYPYSSTANLINHGGSAANAKLVWAKNDRLGYHKEEWMDHSPSDILEEEKTGLLMLLVATRNIAEGEEITIDYGPEWQEAWEQHVNNWSTSKSHVSASELNESEERIQTVFETPYESVSTACNFEFDEEMNYDEIQLDPSDPTRDAKEFDALTFSYDEEALATLKSWLSWVDDHAKVWHEGGDDSTTMTGGEFRPCKVIARDLKDHEDMYTVRLFPFDEDKDGRGLPSDVEYYVKEVPRRAILFVDLPYTSDQHNEKAFRHEIGFPDGDEMWPEVWKDLA